MTRDDHAALVGDRPEDGDDATATRPCSRAALYVTDGDEIDWAYGRHRILMYTFELYPRTPGELDQPASTRPTSSSGARPSATRRRSCTSSSAPGAGTRRSARPRRTAGRCSTTSRRPGLGGGPARRPTPRRPGPGSAPTPRHDLPGGDRDVGLAGARHRRSGGLDVVLVRRRWRRDHDPLRAVPLPNATGD